MVFTTRVTIDEHFIQGFFFDDFSAILSSTKIAEIASSNTSCGLLQVSLNPVRVMKHEADEEKAEIARLSSFVGAMAVGDLVKTTLGPRGMDKILWGMGRNEGQVQVTNDGATILR